ncbi:NAD-dependent epimerase/dehydratase family protein [Propylenella binzhouense]|uniref:NAD(P)-dependent oxidoreductase n=1 Tax=Propylenella binzhouense TaxID=2555902 RepID=A0A964WTH3_9HYPH|nr:NAD(P)-dependent oxidoreductase [Propylenella binzhouense]
MIAAVTGATGYVGQFVVGRLLAEGVAVRAWHRGAVPPPLFPGVEWLAGNLRDAASIGRLVAGAGILVHCALEHVPGRYRGGEGGDVAGFYEANLAGSVRLLQAAREAGVARALVLSSRAALGDSRPAGLLGDDAQPQPDSHYGAVKAALEAVVSAYGRGEGWPVAALRPTGIYGLVQPVERSKWFGLVAAALDGAAAPEPRAGSEVHGADVAEAVWRIVTADPALVAGRAFNCSDLAVDRADLIGILEGLAGRPLARPARAPAPRIVMSCPGLAALGVVFGGRPRLEATVAELAAQVEAGGCRAGLRQRGA